MLRSLILIAFVAFATSEQDSYKNYKVFKVTPSNKEQLDILRQLEYFTNDYEFFHGPTIISDPADIMVSPHRFTEFTELMKEHNIKYELYINDLQSLIDDQLASNLVSNNNDFNTKYHTLEEIYDWLDRLAVEHPDKVQVVIGGKTYEDREIKGIKLSFGQEKPAVFIDGGIHAREWISPATVTYLITQFLNSTDNDVRNLAETYDWYLFPVINPDGYVYSHTKSRLWRKTRSPGFLFCKGTDANRNWDYKWMSGGASKIPCMPNYAGKKAFSEIETKTLSQYLTSIKSKLFAYFSFHSFSQLLMFPYGHTSEHLENYEELSAIAKAGVEALAKRYGTKYRYGNIAETIYTASGSSMDWVKGTLKLPLAYTYELRPSSLLPGFLLPPNQIIPNGQEVLDSFIAMFKEAEKFGYPKKYQQ